MAATSIIWDLGGTLVDTYPDVDRALVQALEEPLTPARLHEVALLTRKSSAHAISVLAERYGVPEETLQAAYDATKEIWRVQPAPVMDGAREVLAAVHAGGGLNLVATHRDRHSALTLLEGLDLDVDDLVCAPDGFPRKPDPAMHLALLERHDLEPAAVLAVGDRPVDVAAAQAAGIRGVLLGTPGVPLHAAGARRIDGLRELLEDLPAGERDGAGPRR